MLQEIKDLKVIDVIGGTLMMLFALGWIDVLWMFGVENSKEYTWWNFIYLMGQ
jgi:exonuclease III|tara:strand:- start:293 stop:451 length:159 start_codon:yes stop_codon:yes gene_type:complete